MAGAEKGSTEPERVSGMGSPVHGAALVSINKEDLEEPLTESDEVAAVGTGSGHGAASGIIKIQSREVSKNPMAAHVEFRAAAANATPPSTFRRPPSRRRKQADPTKSIAEGAPESAGSETPVHGASSSAPAPVTGPQEDDSTMSDGDQGAAPGDDKKQKQACFSSGATVAIAHASPPDSYRLQPSRSMKKSSPTRFIAAGAPALAGAPAASDPPPPAGLGSILPSASASGLRAAARSSSHASASSSDDDRLPSRGRKQPRPEHFIPEEAEASASAKARRGDIVLDRFLSSLVHGSREPRPEWVRNVTADGVRGQRQRSIEGFKISRLGATGGDPYSFARPGCASPSPAAASGSPPGEPDGRGRIYGVLAVLGASLALSVVSCVLFYIVGQRSESGPSGEQEE